MCEMGCWVCACVLSLQWERNIDYHHRDEPDLWNWFVGGMWNRLRVGAKNALAWRKQSVWVIPVGA